VFVHDHAGSFFMMPTFYKGRDDRYSGGQKVGWSVYGHVIAEFSKVDRFSKLWDFELSP